MQKKWNKCEISVKKNQKVSGPGLYKKILLVQMQPNIWQVSKSVPLYFLVYSLLLFGHMTNTAKCNQMMPSAKVWCCCVCKKKTPSRRTSEYRRDGWMAIQMKFCQKKCICWILSSQNLEILAQGQITHTNIAIFSKARRQVVSSKQVICFF